MSLVQRIKEREKENKLADAPLSEMKEMFMGEMLDAVEEFRDDIANFKQQIFREVRHVVEQTLGEEDINTIKGERGYTPMRGIDYLTPEEVAQIKAELKPKDGKDGRNADEEFIISQVLRKIPKQDITHIVRELKELKKNTTKEIDPKILAQMLNSLHGNDRLDYRALKNTPSSTEGGRTMHRGGQGLAVFMQDLSAQCDGATRTFTVPAHTRALWLTTASFPSTYRLTTDFTTAGTVLTIDSALAAPASGETLLFGYAI